MLTLLISHLGIIYTAIQTLPSWEVIRKSKLELENTVYYYHLTKKMVIVLLNICSKQFKAREGEIFPPHPLQKINFLIGFEDFVFTGV